MPAYTVTEIIERAKSAADMRDNFVTTTEWVRWLNVENQQLRLAMARAGWVLDEGREDITANGALSYTLNDPLCVLGVYEYDGQTRYRRLRHSDLMDGAGYHDEVTNGAASTFRVYWDASNGALRIRFWPIPTSGTYKVFVINQPALLTSGSSVNYPAGIEERLVLGLARRALAKEESNTAEMTRQIREMDAHIESLCFDRVLGGHQTVRNVDKVERGWTNTPYIPSREQWLWV
jgi:hypothetical protein